MTTYRIGDWRSDLAAGWVERDRLILCERHYPDARLMSVFVVLVENAGTVVSTEELLEKAWPDRVVGRDSLSTAIYGLRKLLHDDATAPSYIRTEARRGYRLIAPVSSIRRSSHLQTISQQRITVPLAVFLAGVLGATLLDPTSFSVGDNQDPDKASLHNQPSREYSTDMCPDRRNKGPDLVATSSTG